MASKRPLPEDKIELLIKAVQERPILWDTNDSDYGLKRKVGQAWEEVEGVLGVPEDVLKVKWKNIRDIFRRECKKKRVGEGDTYPGPWKYFNSLTFLFSRYPYTEEDSQCPEEDTNETLMDPVKILNLKMEPDEPGEDDVNDEFNCHIYQDIGEDPIATEPKVRRCNGPASNKRKPFTSYPDEEYDTMFLQSLTPYFRCLDPVRKLRLRSKIVDMILEEITPNKSDKDIDAKHPSSVSIKIKPV